MRENPRVLFLDELSRRDSKGFNSQDCEEGSKSMRRVLTSLVEATSARMILTMALVIIVDVPVAIQRQIPSIQTI